MTNRAMRRSWPLPLLAAFILTAGCVSAQKYNQLQSQSTDQQKKLSDSQARIGIINATLDQTNATLKQVVDERDQLRQSNQELTKALSAKKGELAKTAASMSDQNQALQQKIADLTKTQEELKAKAARELAQQTNTYESLMGQLKQEIANGQVKITQIQGKLTVDVADKIFFDSGRAEIKTDGAGVLLRVANVLKQVADKRISIEGHTDNKPITASLQDRYPTNWELSAARAVNVAKFLQEKGGIDPTLLSAVGYGEYHPVAPNDTTQGRAQNRRIEIVLLDKEIGKAAQ